ncbi:hypothetical protein COO60DRAFT_1636128 [Scenedesmus sp. NREL 46B-D3]|nr:hypothetical protein COO60DRAFT_1636128 [Scenedesmus sp. NREL 46B-D3]
MKHSSGSPSLNMANISSRSSSCADLVALAAAQQEDQQQHAGAGMQLQQGDAGGDDGGGLPHVGWWGSGNSSNNSSSDGDGSAASDACASLAPAVTGSLPVTLAYGLSGSSEASAPSLASVGDAGVCEPVVDQAASTAEDRSDVAADAAGSDVDADMVQLSLSRGVSSISSLQSTSFSSGSMAAAAGGCSDNDLLAAAGDTGLAAVGDEPMAAGAHYADEAELGDAAAGAALDDDAAWAAVPRQFGPDVGSGDHHTYEALSGGRLAHVGLPGHSDLRGVRAASAADGGLVWALR